MSDDLDTALPDPHFPAPTWGREGYDASEVDTFVADLRGALRRPAAMAPYQVADQLFKVSRVGRRYRLREVDEYLDAGHDALREQHGDDSGAGSMARGSAPRHFPTLWIYLLALVLVAAMVLFVLTQL